MSDPFSTPADQGPQALYPEFAARIEAAGSLKDLNTAMRAIVEETVRLYPVDKVRQAARQVATGHVALMREATSSSNLDMVKVASKKQILFLVAATRGCAPASIATAESTSPAAPPPAAAQPAPPAPTGGPPAAEATPGEEEKAVPFTVEGTTVAEFFADFLGKYVIHLLSTFHVEKARAPERLPWFLSSGFADRMATVIRHLVAPHLLEYRVMKVRLAENFNVQEQGAAGLLEMVQRPTDNPVHHTWEAFWQPPANGAKPAATDKRGLLLDSVWGRLNAAGAGELAPRDIEVIRHLIRLPLPRVKDELAVAQDSLAKIRDGRLRPTYVRERIEKLMMGGDLPRYTGELILLKLAGDHPDFFNPEWAKWFAAGFRDRPEQIALFQGYYPLVLGAVKG